MSLTNVSVTEFTEQLASKTSVPGGGGASALVGSIGIALGDMVGEFTIGKKKYADVEEDMKLYMQRAQKIRCLLLECIDKDAEAFEPLSKAYAIPKEDPERNAIMEACLKEAAKVPMEILELCCEAIALQKDFAEKGSVIVVSDAATGVAVLRGALQGAAVNVKINTKSMRDRTYAEELNAKVDRLVKEYMLLADEIYEMIYATY